MSITVNTTLTKSRNPTEYGFRLENENGTIVHTLGDGYLLVEFKQFKIKKQVKVYSKLKWIFTPLHWYIHENDLKQWSKN